MTRCSVDSYTEVSENGGGVEDINRDAMEDGGWRMKDWPQGARTPRSREWLARCVR